MGAQAPIGPADRPGRLHKAHASHLPHLRDLTLSTCPPQSTSCPPSPTNARPTTSFVDNLLDVCQRARIGQIIGTTLGGSMMIAAWHVYLGPRPALHPLRRGQSVCVKGISQVRTTFGQMQRDFPLTVRALQPPLALVDSDCLRPCGATPFSPPTAFLLPSHRLHHFTDSRLPLLSPRRDFWLLSRSSRRPPRASSPAR